MLIVSLFTIPRKVNQNKTLRSDSHKTVFSASLFQDKFRYLHLHLSDAFIQSDLQRIQAIHFLSVHVFPGNQTHNLCAVNAMLYH